ncbi:MAG TPA: PQQ-dependent dehydrogenase, methanol/ethanol family, partial [Bryobacterales bacterium]|nr:PQQ-dependent dehydrogenase, methanol/ethanol family [Bryobacterales bacterium]
MRLTKSLLAIVLCAGAAPLGAQDKNPLAGDPEAVQEGKKLFQDSCQICHGGDARGGRGPALATGVFQHGSSDADLYKNINTGIPGTQMPSFDLSGGELWQLVSYIRSLSGTVVEEKVPGDPAAGQKIFAGKGGCQLCHQVNGRGGVVGPDLSAIGRWSAQGLRDVILKPNEREGREPNVVDVKTKDGRQIRGIGKNEDTFSLQLMDTAGKFQLFDKKQLAEIHYQSKSLMPDDYGQRLSRTELQDLVAYLKTQQSRDLAQVAEAPAAPGGLAYDRIAHAEREPQNWLTYWGSYQGRHYSALPQINTSNVWQLRADWAYQIPGGGPLEATPLVVDGVLYTTGPSGYVCALDARSGRLLWQYTWRKKTTNPYDNAKVNRGVAMLGNRVFFTTTDAYLVALDARTGLPLWETQMADVKDGYSATQAPLALKDRIISGISGAEFGVRAHVDAYDPATGKRLWRFWSIPGPGEVGNNTWSGDSWKRGGASTWMTGTYDPEANVLYWGIGNPGPDLNGDVRKGDNLFSCSVVALDPETGKYKWHFQFTPHDTHDWDATETPMLVDRTFRGETRKLMLHADRNAFFYVLDRTSGQFLLGKPFARQTWAKGLDDSGRPMLASNQDPTPEGNVSYPSMWGATNWMAPSYNPATGWLYIAFREFPDRYYKQEQEYKMGRAYVGGKTTPPEEREWGGVKAINPETGNIEWEYKFHLGTLSAGVLSTGGGVVFAASREG